MSCNVTTSMTSRLASLALGAPRPKAAYIRRTEGNLAKWIRLIRIVRVNCFTLTDAADAHRHNTNKCW